MARETDLHEIAKRLEELNRKYDLASQGLKSGSTGVGLGFVVAVLVLAIAAATHLSDDPLFPGNQRTPS